MSPPLILSFSQWEMGRPNRAKCVQHLSLSAISASGYGIFEWQARQGEPAWERDRVRGYAARKKTA
jgi:hypothetical protein